MFLKIKIPFLTQLPLFLSLSLTQMLTADIQTNDPLKHIQTYAGIEEYELTSNGLKVLLYPNETMPIATVMLTYKVGSRNETQGVTGATHILEHMMFKGTNKFPLKDQKDYSSQMERIGARSNATTSNDRTNYYATLPKKYVPLAIELEADRMRNLILNKSELAAEMLVVRNEYERRENNPSETLYKKLFETAYKQHPYHHPIIGWKSDIESITVKKLKRFYDTYYWPNNAVLSVIGGYDKDATLNSIRKHFGYISPSPAPIPELTIQEPIQTQKRKVEVNRAGGVGAVLLANKIPHGTHSDIPELIVLAEILGAEKVGRFYRALEDKGLATNSFAFPIRLKDPGLFAFGAFLTDQSDHESVETILIREIEKVITDGISEEELNRARSVYLNNQLFSKDGTYLIADQINDAIAIGDWKDYHNLPKSIEKVSRKSIQAVAKKYLKTTSRTAAWYIPDTSNLSMTHDLNEAKKAYHYQSPNLKDPSTESNPDIHFTPNIKSFRISNIDITIVQLPIEGVVSFAGSIACGDNKSPSDSPLLAEFTAAMLDQGTRTMNRYEITQRLDSLGIKIAFQTGTQSLEFSGRFLQKDTETFVQTLADQIKNPKFDPEIFSAIKERYKSYLIQYENNTDFMSENVLLRNLYEQGHPNHPSSIQAVRDSIEALSVNDLKNFHNEHYGKKSLKLVFAGDIDLETIQSSVKNQFGNWKNGSDYKAVPYSKKKPQASYTNHFMPDKTSVSVRIAQRTGLKRSDPDYLPFSIANYILGGTYNARLMNYVREDKGLTYAIYSYHSGDILTEGHWMLEATFSPELLDQGMQAIDSVFEDWYSKGVTQKEVNEAIETLKGRYLVGLSQTGSVARQIHSFLQRGYSAFYIDEYPRQLDELTLEQINNSIKKYFNIEALTSVTAGTTNGIQN